jgi:lactate dehydrogenase-like 2-hydroxyacid dehydrogenase
MKNVEILAVGPFYAPSFESMERDFTVHKLWQAKDRNALITEAGGRIRGIATTGGHGADAKLMDALPKLEIISCFGVGVDAIDLDAAKQRGVIVTNTPDVLNECVADLAMGLTVATLRRISLGDRYVRAGRPGRAAARAKVGGKTMGILGYGRIGGPRQARRAFGMRIVYHGRSRRRAWRTSTTPA